MGFQRKNMFESNGITSIFTWRNVFLFFSNLHKEHKMGLSLAWHPFAFFSNFVYVYSCFFFALVFFVACSFLVICFTSLNSSCIVLQLLLHYCLVCLTCYSTSIVIWLYFFNLFGFAMYV